MASDVEVERLLVRLLGDGSQFQKMLATAQQSTVATMQAVQRATVNIESYQKSIEGFARTAMSALASYGIIEWLKGARQAFEDFDMMVMKLNNSIRMNGGDVEKMTKDYEKFAKAIAEVTNTTKGEVLQMLARMEAQGISGDLAKAAVKNTMALGAAAVHVRGSWQTMHASIALAQGNMHQAAHLLGIDMKKFKDETALTVEVQRRLTNGWELAQIQAQTNSAVWKKLGATFNELRKDVGKILSEQMVPMLKVLQQLADMFKNLDDATKGVVIRLGVMLASSLLLRPALMFIIRPLTELITGFLTLGFHLVATTFKLAALVVAKTISTGVWIAYAGAVTTVQIAMFVVGSTISAVTAIVGVCTGAVSALGAVMAILGAAASVIAGIGMAAMFTAAGVAAYLLWKTMSDLSGKFGDLVEHVSVLKTVGNPFEGWGKTLETVLDLMQKDIPSALKLVQLQIEVTWSKMKDAAGPVWEYIKSTASAVWEYVASTFKFHMNAAWAWVLGKAIGFMTTISDAFTTGVAATFDLVVEFLQWRISAALNSIFPVLAIIKDLPKLLTLNPVEMAKSIDDAMTAARKAYVDGWKKLAGAPGALIGIGEAMGDAVGKAYQDALNASDPAVQKATENLINDRLKAAREAFAVVPSDATKKAVDALEAELFKLRNKEGGLDFIGPLKPKLMNDALNTGNGIGDSIVKGFKAVKVQAQIFGSAEDIAQFTEFQQTLAFQVASINAGGNPSGTVPTYPKLEGLEANSAEALGEARTANDLLRAVIDALTNPARGGGGVMIGPAGIGGGR